MHITLTDQIKDILCEKGLKEYNIEVSNIIFIRHSENLTYRIYSKEGSYLLRIHYPLSGIADKKWIDKKVINSELLWLKALNEHIDIKVQLPIYNKSGKLVTVIKYKSKEILCSLLTWIEGTVRYESKEYTLAQAENLGSLLAQLHNQSSNWSIPKGFIRPISDLNALQEDFEKLKKKNTELKFFDKDSELKIQRAINKIGYFFEKDLNQNNWGLIHTDLCENNYILNGDNVYPIDFSLCSFGSYTFDITVSLLHIFNNDMWTSFFKGYCTYRPLGNNVKKAIEAYFIAALIGPWAFHCTNTKEHKWLNDSITKCLNDYIPPFLKNQEFIFSKFNIDFDNF